MANISPELSIFLMPCLKLFSRYPPPRTSSSLGPGCGCCCLSILLSGFSVVREPLGGPSVPRACLSLLPCAGSLLNQRVLSMPSACCSRSTQQTLALHLLLLVCCAPSRGCSLRRAECICLVHSFCNPDLPQ